MLSLLYFKDVNISFTDILEMEIRLLNSLVASKKEIDKEIQRKEEIEKIKREMSK